MSAHISAAALHLLLATHPELEDMPIVWTVELDRTIRPFIAVNDPQAEESMRLLAAALELDLVIRPFGINGEPKCSLHTGGRWGGATWECTTYVHRAVPAAEGGAR